MKTKLFIILFLFVNYITIDFANAHIGLFDILPNNQFKKVKVRTKEENRVLHLAKKRYLCFKVKAIFVNKENINIKDTSLIRNIVNLILETKYKEINNLLIKSKLKLKFFELDNSPYLFVSLINGYRFVIRKNDNLLVFYHDKGRKDYWGKYSDFIF